jgi:hypothetical protein
MASTIVIGVREVLVGISLLEGLPMNLHNHSETID